MTELSPWRRTFAHGRALVAAATLLALTTACVDVDVPDSLPDQAPTTEAPRSEDTAVPEQQECLASLRPDGPAGQDVAAGSYMDEIRRRDEPRLRVGVDVGTPGFSSANVETGEPEGFDVDIAREVADALLGDPEAVDLLPITAGERVEALAEGRVDLVAHNFTITCSRREEIAFSTEYYTAGQRMLVQRNNPAESLEDLDNGRVCATAGSTALDHVETLDGPLPVRVPDRNDCLVLLQQGQVDAAATDDAILAGLAAQDPDLEIRGEVFSEEPYGLGLPPDRPEWVRYVNAVLEDVRDSGRWAELADEWLADIDGLDVAASPPEPAYSD